MKGGREPFHTQLLGEDQLEMTTKLLESWPTLTPEQRIETFQGLDRQVAEEIFLSVSAIDQAELFQSLKRFERWSWIRLLAPDDVADLIQDLPLEMQPEALQLLDPKTRIEVTALLAYREDHAGGIMNSRFVAIRPNMTAEEAFRYLRLVSRDQVETIYFAYVLDNKQKLIGVVSLRQIFQAPGDKKIEEMMVREPNIITIPDTMDQEEIGRFFMQKNLSVLPVVDPEGRMKGVVTFDDIADVVEEEATEDIQKMGGMEAFDEPYFRISFAKLIQKRAGWLLILFIGEMFTATAMGYFQHEIERAVVLALFIPLIISSGGNSGSQASTLVIRAMALGEVKIKDWFRVLWRELATGVVLGAILGSIGLLRILVWPAREKLYGEHYISIAFTVAVSLVGVVLWGTLSGSMLPFLLRRLGFDPATASAPFVATLVDVTGLVIYFSVAMLMLSGVLL